jgi:hypothetical protein
MSIKSNDEALLTLWSMDSSYLIENTMRLHFNGWLFWESYKTNKYNVF